MNAWIQTHVIAIDALALLLMAVGLAAVLAVYKLQGSYVEDRMRLQRNRLEVLISSEPPSIEVVPKQLQEVS